MTKEYVKYKSFYDLKEGESYKDYITQLGFEANLHTYKNNLTELTGEGIQPVITVWVLLEDLVKINQKIKIEILNDKEFLETHYLKDFDQEELQEILLNEEEWSYEDVIVAKIFLRESGLDHDRIVNIQNENQQKLKLGKHVSNPQVLGIIVALILAAYFLNYLLFIGIIGQGAYYRYDMLTDHKGNKYYRFNENVRTTGAALILIGVLYSVAVIGKLLYLNLSYI